MLQTTSNWWYCFLSCLFTDKSALKRLWFIGISNKRYRVCIWDYKQPWTGKTNFWKKKKKKKRNGHKREANVSHKALLGDFVT